jgi:hypothetical protein
MELVMHTCMHFYILDAERTFSWAFWGADLGKGATGRSGMWFETKLNGDRMSWKGLGIFSCLKKARKPELVTTCKHLLFHDLIDLFFLPKSL